MTGITTYGAATTVGGIKIMTIIGVSATGLVAVPIYLVLVVGGIIALGTYSVAKRFL